MASTFRTSLSVEAIASQTLDSKVFSFKGVFSVARLKQVTRAEITWRAGSVNYMRRALVASMVLHGCLSQFQTPNPLIGKLF